MRNADVSTSFACFAVLCLAAAAGAAEHSPQITSTQRYVFSGQTACVCGHFPTPESRSGLTIGGLPLGAPVSASSSRLEFRVPDGVPPGPQWISGPVSAGFAPGSGAGIEVLQLQGSIDQELLRSGQSTPMEIRIVGTDDRLELRLTNETPQVIAIEGGDEGVVRTSGGAENTVARTVRGLRPGDFDITYGVADDPCPCPPAAADGPRGVPGGPPLVQRGYPMPDGMVVVAALGTGRTTGHIADITVVNSSPAPVLFPDRAAYIPATGMHQPYVVPGGSGSTIPAGATRTVPIEGYCGDIRRPPVPAGEPFPGPEDWIVPVDPARTVPPPPVAGEPAAGAPPTRALVPGSDRPLPGVIDPDADPETAATYLWAAVDAIERAVAALQASGELRTPFASDPDREREAVVQQVLWRYAGELEGEPYTREEFEAQLVGQYEERTGRPVAQAPAADRERLAQGADDFWDAFELVGVEAKVLISDDEVPAGEDEPEQITEDVEPPCDIAKTMEHSEPGSDFEMSESYKDEDKRANLREWFDDLPDPTSGEQGGTFEAGTYPASAWALAGRDFVGGYCNAVAKHVFQEAGGGTDWVWTTELLEVEARSEGSHTVTVTPPPGGDCQTLVVGAAGGLVKAWSNAIDPVADSRGIIEALRVVRDVAIIVASATAAPFTAGASIAVGVGVLAASKAFDAEFTSDANAAAAVEGRMRLQVKNRWITLDANSRSSVSGSGAIESDEAKVAKGQTSAQDPLTLTATTEGFSTLKTRAEDNGIAEGTVESQIGITIVGFCICDGDVQIEYLLDSGLFLAEEGAAGTATRVRVQLEEKLADVIAPYAEMDEDEIIPSARDNLQGELEAMLEGWYQDNAGRFNLPAE